MRPVGHSVRALNHLISRGQQEHSIRRADELLTRVAQSIPVVRRGELISIPTAEVRDLSASTAIFMLVAEGVIVED